MDAEIGAADFVANLVDVVTDARCSSRHRRRVFAKLPGCERFAFSRTGNGTRAMVTGLAVRSAIQDATPAHPGCRPPAGTERPAARDQKFRPPATDGTRVPPRSVTSPGQAGNRCRGVPPRPVGMGRARADVRDAVWSSGDVSLLVLDARRDRPGRHRLDRHLMKHGDEFYGPADTDASCPRRRPPGRHRHRNTCPFGEC